MMAIRPDNRLDDAPMVPVACTRCGAGVQVRKSSWNQTSVQWTGPRLEPMRRAMQRVAVGGERRARPLPGVLGSQWLDRRGREGWDGTRPRHRTLSDASRVLTLFGVKRSDDHLHRDT